MNSDPANPGGKRGIPPKILEIFHGIEKRLLGDILGILFMTKHAHGQGINLFFMAKGKLLEGRQLTSLGALDEFSIRNIAA